jgi:hypothetical protein
LEEPLTKIKNRKRRYNGLSKNTIFPQNYTSSA